MEQLEPFPNQDYEDALAFAIQEAKVYGLGEEVQETFENFVGNRKMTRSEYFYEAHSALYEWDI